jgi:hypothetical protein
MLYHGTVPEIGDREAQAKLLDMQLFSLLMFFLVPLSQLPERNRKHFHLIIHQLVRLEIGHSIIVWYPVAYQEMNLLKL